MMTDSQLKNFEAFAMQAAQGEIKTCQINALAGQALQAASAIRELVERNTALLAAAPAPVQLPLTADALGATVREAMVPFPLHGGQRDAQLQEAGVAVARAVVGALSSPEVADAVCWAGNNRLYVNGVRWREMLAVAAAKAATLPPPPISEATWLDRTDYSGTGIGPAEGAPGAADRFDTRCMAMTVRKLAERVAKLEQGGAGGGGGSNNE